MAEDRKILFILAFVMSVILLTTLPSTLASIRERDPHATQLDGTSAILSSKAAVLCAGTLDNLCAEAYIERPDSSTERTTVHIGNCWVLRITHSSGLMGPSRCLNIGPGAFTAPWGIWILFKVDENKRPINIGPIHGPFEEEVLHGSFCVFDVMQAHMAYECAKRYTHEYSAHNRHMAKFLNY